jgi:hypothetical protein
MTDVVPAPRCQCPEVGVPCPACVAHGPVGPEALPRNRLTVCQVVYATCSQPACQALFVLRPSQRHGASLGARAYCSPSCAHRAANQASAARKLAKRAQALGKEVSHAPAHDA